MPVRLGNFIRARRLELGLTQEQLAERIGDTVRQAEVSRLEHNRIALPRRERLVSIAEALEVSLGELLVQTGWMDEERDLDALVAAAGLGDSGAATELPDADAAAEIESVKGALAAALDMLDRTTEALKQTQEALDTLQQAVQDMRNPRSEIRPKIGIVDTWESTAVFATQVPMPAEEAELLVPGEGGQRPGAHPGAARQSVMRRRPGRCVS